MKILLGLSGGVDSTYAALKLKNEGHEVHGAVALMHDYTDTAAAECAAREIGIPFYKIDARELFLSTVCENFVSEYTSGRTPNPFVLCNREVKFKALCDFALKNGFDAVATGHYARIGTCDTDGGVRYFVKRAKDESKDQSYMLSRLSQDQLSMLVLPMGEEIKTDITDKAKGLGLSSADRGESQEICFIPDGKYTEYIEARAGATKRGSFVDREGRVLGEHKGIIHYTVGQRKGLEIALGKRVFVTEINATDNTVTLEDSPRLFGKVLVSDIVFSKLREPNEELTLALLGKLRYLAKPERCELTVGGDRTATAVFELPQRSVTPGQSAVFYDGDDVVLSGIIVGAE